MTSWSPVAGIRHPVERAMVAKPDQVGSAETARPSPTVSPSPRPGPPSARAAARISVRRSSPLRRRSSTYSSSGWTANADVGNQRPRSRRPHQHPAARVAQVERDVDARILDVLVPQRDLVTGERRLAPRAVGKNLVPVVQQTALPECGQRPPDALDVLGRVGDVGVAVVEPVPDALRSAAPTRSDTSTRCSRHSAIESLDAQRFDLRLGRDPELLLDLDLDRQPVRVPARLPRHVEPAHGPVPAEQILQRSREHMMNARPAVRRRRVPRRTRTRPAGRDLRASWRRDARSPTARALRLPAHRSSLRQEPVLLSTSMPSTVAVMIRCAAQIMAVAPPRPRPAR